MPCATFVQSKGEELDKQPHTFEDVAEEMLNGILCHYEPPDPKKYAEREKEKRKKRGGILRAPGRMFGRRSNKKSKKKDSDTPKSVRWSDTQDEEDEAARKAAAALAEEEEEDEGLLPVEITCNPLGATCIEVGVESGCVSPSELERNGINNYKSKVGYDVIPTKVTEVDVEVEQYNIPLPPSRKKTPKKMSQKAMMMVNDDDDDEGQRGKKKSKKKKGYESDDEEELVYDEDGYPRKSSKSKSKKPPPPPPPPPPQAEEKYMPQLKGVKINLKEDEAHMKELARSSRDGPPSKKSQYYRPRQDYDEIDNSLIGDDDTNGSGSGSSGAGSHEDLVKRIERKKASAANEKDNDDDDGSVVSSHASSLFHRIWPLGKGRGHSQSPGKQQADSSDSQARGRSPSRKKRSDGSDDWDESVPIVPGQRRRSTGEEGGSSGARKKSDRDPSPGGIRPSRSHSADAHEERSSRRPVSRSASPGARANRRSQFHPAHPLARSAADPVMYSSDMAERQSYITAHRQAFNDDAMERQSFITAHRQGFDAASSSGGRGGAPGRYYSSRDDQMERQSYITAHRHSFEPTPSRQVEQPRKTKKQLRVLHRRSPSPSRHQTNRNPNNIRRGRSPSPAGRNQRRGRSAERVQKFQPTHVRTIPQRLPAQQQQQQQQQRMVQQKKPQPQRVARKCPAVQKQDPTKNRSGQLPTQQPQQRASPSPMQRSTPTPMVQQQQNQQVMMPSPQQLPVDPPPPQQQQQQQQQQYYQQQQAPPVQQQPIQVAPPPPQQQQYYRQQEPQQQTTQPVQQVEQPAMVQQQTPVQQPQQQPFPSPNIAPQSQPQIPTQPVAEQPQSQYQVPQQGSYPEQSQGWVTPEQQKAWFEYMNCMTPEQRQAWFDYQQVCAGSLPQQQSYWPQMQCPVDFPMLQQEGSQPTPMTQPQQQEPGQNIPMQRSSQSDPVQTMQQQVPLQRSTQSVPTPPSTWNGQAPAPLESPGKGKHKKKGWGLFRKNKKDPPSSPSKQNRQGLPSPVQWILPDVPKNQRTMPAQPQIKIYPMMNTANVTQQQQQQRFGAPPPAVAPARPANGTGSIQTDSASQFRNIPQVLPLSKGSGDSNDSNRSIPDPLNVHPPTPKGKEESSMISNWLPGITYPSPDPVSVHDNHLDPRPSSKAESNSTEQAKEEEAELSWEERTRQAWEQLRSGFFETPNEEESKPSNEDSNKSKTEEKDTTESEKKLNQPPKQEQTASNQEAAPGPMQPPYPYYQELQEEYRPEPVFLPEPAPQGILKQPSYDRRVRFTAPTERVYNNNEYQMNDVSSSDDVQPMGKRRALRGKKILGGLFGRGNNNKGSSGKSHVIPLTLTKSTEAGSSGSWDSYNSGNRHPTNNRSDLRQPQEGGYGMNDQQQREAPPPQSQQELRTYNPTNYVYDSICPPAQPTGDQYAPQAFDTMCSPNPAAPPSSQNSPGCPIAI